jgi:hypothetical protein
MKPTRPRSAPVKDAPGMGQARRQSQDYESLGGGKKGAAPTTSLRPKARPTKGNK